MIWPAHLEGFFARGVETMVLRIDMEGSKLEPQYPYLHPLFDVYRPWTEAGVWTLWVALVSRDADLRRLAIDALIFGVTEGMASTDLLSDVFVKLGKSESLKLNRAADSLGEVARVDDLHRGVVAYILERYVASLSGLPRGSHHILELLHESLTVLGGPLHPGAAQVLRGVKGSGKAAKLAKQLVAFEGMGPSGGRALAHQRAWDARVGWAQRMAGGLRNPIGPAPS
jgi:hypothetical protein